MDLRSWFTELYIHEKSWDSPVAQRVRGAVDAEAVVVTERPYQSTEGRLSGSDFDHSKKRLYLAPHEGHFFKKCPGTHGAACCNYFVLNLGVQCPMNCSYCYLQSYVNSPVTQIHTNIEDALAELEDIAVRSPNLPFRVGTGETIDSLALDDLTFYSRRLVEWFSKFPHLTCEFKTKSDNIKNFVDQPHAHNVVVSFSVNPQEIVASEEHETATLAARLAAARLAADRGFPVAFHIDPMIYVEGWQRLYGELVERITGIFSRDEVRWISVGALRFPPDMKQILRERFAAPLPAGQSLPAALALPAALGGEMFLSDDGKLRYDQNLRNKMFSYVVSEFKKRDPRYPVFLCMEATESWLGTFEATPRKVEAVAELFRPLIPLARPSPVS